MSRFVAEGSKEDNAAEANDAWTRAKQEVEALKKPKQAPGSGLQEGGISLYETLQANKEKKQAEFEESQGLKNQFQTLNDDDVDFLDSVLDSNRAKEAAEKRETAERLEAFRKQKQEAEKKATPQVQSSDASGDGWTKKRRRKDTDATGATKLRKTSTSLDKPPVKPPSSTVLEDALLFTSKTPPNGKDPVQSKSTATLGLGVYDSDDD